MAVMGFGFTTAAQTISTVAGDGSAGIGATGTGGSNSVAVDSLGNIYVSTGGLNTIRKITTANVVTTFAGTGTAGFSGDNGQASAATFRNIQDLYIAGSNLYVADAGNKRIRKISLSSNVVTTVAGDGTANITGNGIGGAAGVAVDSLGNIYVACGGAPVIRKITPGGVHSTFAGTGATGFSGDNGQASAATFNLPSDLFVSQGKLYIADTRNRRIRSINLSTNVITTVAGDGTTGITGNGIGAANSVAADGGGNIFVTTGAAGNAVRKITGSTYTTISGGNATGGFSGDNGAPAGAALNLPTDLFIQGSNLYVADLRNRRVRRMTNTTIPLPLQLLQFTANAVRNEVLVQWTTAMEKNVAGFDVERSNDALHFETAGYVAGKGNALVPYAYTFTDISPLDGKSFYRLKMMDMDGSFSYSPVAAVVRQSAGGQVTLSPVPAQTALTLIVGQQELINTTAQVFDMQGRQVSRFVLAYQQQLDIAAWASGIYYLKLADGSTVKFVKE
jgi:hypothetical protein